MTTLMTTIRDDYDRHPTPPDAHDRWAHHNPALALPASELVRRVITWDHVRGDAVLIPLQQLAVAGDREAARLIVYALSPRLAARTRRQCTAHRDEVVAELIGHLYEAAVTPHPGWTARYSDQLVRHAIRARQGSRGSRQPDIAPLDRDIAEPGDPYDAVDHATDVANFLTPQTSQGRIGPATALALHRHASGRHVPQPHGTRTADTNRKRRQRDIRRLRAIGAPAVHDLLAACA